jgi:hypothetical protein
MLKERIEAMVKHLSVGHEAREGPGIPPKVINRKSGSRF